MESTEKLSIKKGLMNFYVRKPLYFGCLKAFILEFANIRFSKGLIHRFQTF